MVKPKSSHEMLAQGYQGSEAERASRQIVAFYSCRGGVGRTMALCNVASYLAGSLRVTGRPARDILCVDLDFEAPGVATFLRSDSVAPSGGLAQLFIDFSSQFKEGSELGACTPWLAKAFSPEGGYIYRVPSAENLYVLPAGVDLMRTVDALAQERFAKFRLHLPGAVAKMTLLQEALRETLRARYAYTLLDCWAGAPSLEFTLASALSDALVLFFRPNFSQLFGVNRALATFLGDRRRKVTEADVPVLPVLSPRPAYTDRRIRQIRKFASEKMFRWLGSGAEENTDSSPPILPRYEELIELPFDNTVEVDELLLIPLKARPIVTDHNELMLAGLDFPDADDEAPLFLGYQRLAEALQKANFRRDVAGAWMREEEALSVADVALGIQYFFCALEAEPNQLRHWRRLWSQYTEFQLDDNGPMHHTIRAFCARPWEKEQTPTAYVMGRIWLADFVHRSDERTMLRLLGEAWECAWRQKRSDLLREALQFLSRYLADHPSTEPTPPLPRRRTALDVRAMQVFSETPQLNSIFDQLCLLERRYRIDPSHSKWLEEVLCDQLRVAEDSALRAAIFTDLGNYYRQSLQLSAARWAYGAALKERSCPAVEAGFVLDRLLRLMPTEDWKLLAAEHQEDLSPKLAAALDGEINRREPKDFGEEVWGSQARIHLVLEALQVEDTATALKYCLEPWGSATERLPLLSLVLWLRGDPHAIPRALVTEALDRWDGVPPHPRAVSSSVAYYLLAAWAGDPGGVAAHAARGLKKTNWPIGKFWYLFFASSGVNATEHRRQLRQLVEDTPLLARWVVASEIFFLYRQIWRQQKSLHVTIDNPSETDIRAFDEELNFLEAQAKVPLSEVTKVPEVNFVGNELTSTLKQVAEHWRQRLEKGVQQREALELISATSP